LFPDQALHQAAHQAAYRAKETSSAGKKALAFALFSAALLTPCFWQSRIQAADLSSHIYNAWLVVQIHRGAAPGLWIASQSTNILFDLILAWLFAHAGPDWAQKLAVAFCVLIFGWGAICFIFRAGKRNWWFSAPCVAMLSYGFIFHMGFFNFYLSLGLCLWYPAITWKQSWKVHFLAAPLLVLAWTAHPFPVLWALGTAAYIAVARRLKPARTLRLLALAVLALAVASYILAHRYGSSWSFVQAFFISGADQLDVFGPKYKIPFAATLLLWMVLLRKLAKLGVAELLQNIPFQLWILNAAAVVLLPEHIAFQQYGLPFGFITDRLSLCAALMMCATLAAAPAGKFEKIGLAAVAVVFFSFLYFDGRQLNRIEDRIDAVVQTLPAGERVVNTLPSLTLRSLCLQHDLDRACIGHCYSYANYEPPSRQFRVRALPGNRIVLANQPDVNAIVDGKYVVQLSDLPLHLVYLCGPNLTEVCLRPLHAGETNANPN
jgi:hypothetical protein